MVDLHGLQRPPKAIRQLGYYGHQEANIYVEHNTYRGSQYAAYKKSIATEARDQCQKTLLFAILLHEHSMTSEQSQSGLQIISESVKTTLGTWRSKTALIGLNIVVCNYDPRNDFLPASPKKS